jgi:two-component system nitrate/nitrite sensor histidine kinase NarX
MNPSFPRIVDDPACRVADLPCATVLNERRMMAAEVHDSIAQTLTFVKMRLPLIEDALQVHDERLARHYLADVRQAVGEAHGSLRAIITQLRVPVDPRGLGPALQTLATRFRERSGLPLDLSIGWPAEALAPEAETDVFHVVQEALVNVERHARARQAWVQLEALPGGALRLRVDDDGTGPQSAAGEEAGHHGRSIMAERAHRLGGTLEVAGRPGGGTRVQLLLTRAGTGGSRG